jgi:hypothetical protein
MARGPLPGLLAAAIALAALPRAEAAGPPVAISAAPGTDAGLVRRVRDVVASRRALREDLALPPAASVSPERAAMAERAASIRLALERARRAESEAAWDACVREATSAMSDAVEVLARVDDLLLLRDLNVQIGACLTLAGSASSARSYFVSAALLDESKPKLGLHREEAERAQAEALAEVTSRARGKVRIETTPPGADLWIDGHREGQTPIEVDVRLGEHFVTVRRFRFEPHTELTRLSPSGSVRVALDPAQRGTLRDQLAAVAAGTIAPAEDELRLGRAVWSRAEQLVAVAPAGLDGCRVRVLDAITGQTLRTAQLARRDDDDAVRRAVCDALGETCEPRSRGVPWYVWPIAGVALAGGVVSTAFLINQNRDYKFVACPNGGSCK